MQVTIRVRMSAHDAHYGGNLVDGAKMLELFGDVATGAFGKRMIENHIKPEYECFEMGHLDTILTMARKVITARPDINDSAAEVLAEPILVCRASGTCVTPKDKQRNN